MLKAIRNNFCYTTLLVCSPSPPKVFHAPFSVHIPPNKTPLACSKGKKCIMERHKYVIIELTAPFARYTMYDVVSFPEGYFISCTRKLVHEMRKLHSFHSCNFRNSVLTAFGHYFTLKLMPSLRSGINLNILGKANHIIHGIPSKRRG